MTRDEKQEFKHSIEEQMEFLSDEIKEIKSSMYPEKGKAPLDKVAHLHFKMNQSINIQRYQETTKRLNRLKNAYQKVDTPEYGICKECEEEIPLARLKLMPESLYCVSCMNELGL